MSARGCAAAVCGEPITKTIEVANGTKRRGMAERSASNSITAMAIAATGRRRRRRRLCARMVWRRVPQRYKRRVSHD